MRPRNRLEGRICAQTINIPHRGILRPPSVRPAQMFISMATRISRARSWPKAFMRMATSPGIMIVPWIWWVTFSISASPVTLRTSAKSPLNPLGRRRNRLTIAATLPTFRVSLSSRCSVLVFFPVLFRPARRRFCNSRRARRVPSTPCAL